MSADAVSPDLSRDVAVPVKDGGLLTPREMAALRAAVQFTRPPDMMLACCEPRHAFLFYDKSGRYLGFLMVCFECGCAVMEPFHPADEEHSWIAWNPEAVKAIVVAHQLAPLVPPRS
ncbi:MAG TPA: hypothetical protein VKU90_16555 [Caulobacteraceae bacterium]|nr:hypothetical protein [Caulobacteraceae bacterium]